MEQANYDYVAFKLRLQETARESASSIKLMESDRLHTPNPSSIAVGVSRACTASSFEWGGVNHYFRPPLPLPGACSGSSSCRPLVIVCPSWSLLHTFDHNVDGDGGDARKNREKASDDCLSLFYGGVAVN